MWEEKRKFYEVVVEKCDGVELKGKTMPYTSANGHMFSFLDKEGKMGLRLSKDDLAQFLDEFESKVMEQHGRVMKEFAEVPGELMGDVDLMVGYLDRSWKYVMGLKPKGGKKK